ncbi:Uncharacterized protein ALO43_00487 [Pseudomonas tremae]|uniref:Uncharacterized protein n=1 Tax=Pseudomonas tremae TaxID=200454 RepID=A0AA40P8W9_9PSED|nr:Uncharacterized protein ALO89_02467 [Pseudomonas coronafaciens pv. porri]KPZ07344.1 Uncharacterized protein ALO43_00487 [Pseudomonas tremae]RMM32175.1 hypothetical protein ALQ80_01321 [Pseudomonas coronafaciens pv. oryzae]RMN33871.1 hypothetical protein ALQ61_05386 [Pseudomonas coronafaciens pv. zizaniae]RMO10106.1 hypothetical protein ALQ48_05252 [Pseudomonas coronafaciens pv. zizaniae]
MLKEGRFLYRVIRQAAFSHPLHLCINDGVNSSMNIIDFKQPVKRSHRVSTATVPVLEKVLTVILKTDVPVLMGICSDGLRSNSAILGGEFQGESFSGSVLSGGSNLLVEMSSELAVLDTRFTLRTQMGELINVENRGIMLLDEAGQQELQNGIWPISEGHYQCSCTPRFQVSLGPNEWLEKSAFIGKIEYLYAHEMLISFYRMKP